MKPRLYHEMYGRYFKIVDKLLKLAQDRPLSSGEIGNIACDMGYDHTHMILPDMLLTGTISSFRNAPPLPAPPLFDRQEGDLYGTKIKPRVKPLSLLERRWLAAILRDPRIKLFMNDDELDASEKLFQNTDPLFYKDDFFRFDASLQPDHFENDAYRQIFRSILYALCSSKPLEIQYRDHDGGLIRDTVRPEKIEYSLKEDRFRLLCSTANRNTALGGAINIGDIVDAKEAESSPRPEKNIPANPQSKPRKELKHASLRVKNERGAGERAQMQFANYKIYAGGSEDFMELEIGYPESNEPELLDEILAFGPLIKVNHFDGDLLKKIRERLDTQRKLMSAPQKT